MNKIVIVVIGRNDHMIKCLKKHIHIKNYNNINFSKNIFWKFHCDNSIDFLDHDGLLDILEETNPENMIVVNIDKFDEKIDCDLNELVLFEKNNKFNLNLLNACIELKIKNYINVIPKTTKDLDTEQGKKDNNLLDSYGLLCSKLITSVYVSTVNKFSDKFNYTNIYISDILSEYVYLDEDNLIYKIIKLLDECSENIITLSYNPDQKIDIIPAEFFIEILLSIITTEKLEKEYELSLDSDQLLTISDITNVINEYINNKYNKNTQIHFNVSDSRSITKTISNNNISDKEVLKRYNQLDIYSIDIKAKIIQMIEFYYTNKEHIIFENN